MAEAAKIGGGGAPGPPRARAPPARVGDTRQRPQPPRRERFAPRGPQIAAHRLGVGRPRAELVAAGDRLDLEPAVGVLLLQQFGRGDDDLRGSLRGFHELIEAHGLPANQEYAFDGVGRLPDAGVGDPASAPGRPSWGMRAWMRIVPNRASCMTRTRSRRINSNRARNVTTISRREASGGKSASNGTPPGGGASNARTADMRSATVVPSGGISAPRSRPRASTSWNARNRSA